MGIVQARLLSRVAAALLGSGLLGTARLVLASTWAARTPASWSGHALITDRQLQDWSDLAGGWQLRVEQPVDTSKGMAPSA